MVWLATNFKLRRPEDEQVQVGVDHYNKAGLSGDIDLNEHFANLGFQHLWTELLKVPCVKQDSGSQIHPLTDAPDLIALCLLAAKHEKLSVAAVTIQTNGHLNLQFRNAARDRVAANYLATIQLNMHRPSSARSVAEATIE